MTKCNKKEGFENSTKRTSANGTRMYGNEDKFKEDVNGTNSERYDNVHTKVNGTRKRMEKITKQKYADATRKLVGVNDT